MKINIINKSEFDLPKYETSGSVGMDLRANLKGIKDCNYEEGLLLKPHKQYIIPTGIYISLPKPTVEEYSDEGWGYEAQIRPRSGLAAKHGISIVNSPGTIDCDYRGEIKVILINETETPFKIEHGDRIAQMIISRYERIIWNEVNNLDETERGEGGFSSTGIK